MKEQELIVMKFGGSSIENAGRFNHAAEIIRDYSQDNKVVVVVSAIYGVTNRLFQVIEDIKAGNQQIVSGEIESLYQLHSDAMASLGLDQQRPLVDSLHRFRSDIRTFVAIQELQPPDEDFIASYGERLSYLLLSGAVNKLGVSSQPVDAAQVIITDGEEYGNARADLLFSKYQAGMYIEPLLRRGVVPVMGGFYGLSGECRIAVLGRGGSDYSAAILANIMDADRLILWKEVDGIYSADPKKDPFAEFLPQVSYDVAEDLARNKGAKILHPESIGPLRAKNIPIEVRNFDNPKAEGSIIR